MKAMLVTLILVLVGTAHGGGMVSSGGGLLRDAHNPWWVKNTKQVKYCVAVDSATISAPTGRVNALVKKSLEYWKMEFSRKFGLVSGSPIWNAKFNELGVGTQDFIEVDCNGTEDLRFQFGYGTLNEEQIKFIPDLRTQIGLAVRTNYDETKLKGRGYIYVASDMGPKSYDGGPQLIAKPWQYEFFLYMTLVHELGHVFGIPHFADTFMSDRYLEFMLNKAYAEYLKNWKVTDAPLVPFFFTPSNYFVHCEVNGFTPAARYFLAVNANFRCLHFSVDKETRQIGVLGSVGPLATPVYIGTISGLRLDGEAGAAVNLFVTEKQIVFPKLTGPFQIMGGPMFVRKKGPGIYTPIGGTARAVHVDLDPRTSFSLVGLTSTGLETILSAPMKLVPHW